MSASCREAPPPSASLLRSIVLLSVAAFASSGSMRICDPMLPRLAEDFGASLQAVSSVVTWFAVAYGVLQIAWGPIGDRVGKFRMSTIATTLAAAASMACALAPDLSALTLARFAAGSIAAAIIPLSLAWIGDVVSFEHRQPVLARFMSGSILGVVCGQLMGGLLVDSLGWRWAFALLACVFVLAASLLWRELPHVTRADPFPSGTPSIHASPNRLASGSMLAAYLHVLRDAWVQRMLLLVTVEGMLVFGVLAFIPSSLHDRLHLPLWSASLVASGFAIGGLLYTTLARRFIARLGERGLAVGGGLTLAVGIVTMGLAPVWPVALAGCLVMGVGFYGMHNTMQNHGTQMAPAHRGLGVALFAFSFFAGQSAGVAIASRLITRHGFAPVFVGCALLLALLGAGFSWGLGWRHARAGSAQG